MRLSITAALITTCLFFAHSQNKDTLYFENFEGANPNFTTVNSNGNGNLWQVNSRLAYRGAQSVRVQPDPDSLSTIELITDTFRVAINDFVRLEWAQIAKLPTPGGGEILVSNNGGNSWLLLTRQNTEYYGNGNSYSSSTTGSFINISAYGTSFTNNWLGPVSLPANNKQWKKEGLDLSGVVFGQTDVLIKFRTRLVNQANLKPQPDGWYLDDLAIIRDSCEPFKPQISVRNNLAGCQDVPLRGGQKAASNNQYSLRIKVNDFVSARSNGVSGIDSVTLYYRNYSQGNMGAWQTQSFQKMPGGIYNFNFNAVMPGDTVQYYIEAVDNSCTPNTAHYPVINRIDSSYLFYPEQLPGICGGAACNKSPGIINSFPWHEDFEDSEWAPGSGNGFNGAAIRGAFANEGIENAAWTLKPNENQAGYGWAVRSGATPSPATGPSSNNTPGGHKYLYTEASPGTTASATQLIMPCIDLSTDTIPKILSFYYHRFGKDMPNLRIDIDTGNNINNYIIKYDKLSGQNQTTAKDAWKKKSINLAPFAGKVIRVRFFAAKLNTNDSLGDMALDDFSIFNTTSRDVEVKAAYNLIDSAGCFKNNSQVPLALSIKNLGQELLDTIPLAIEVSQNNNITTLSDTLIVSLNPFNNLNTTLNQKIDLSQPGNYSVRVFAELPGDLNADNDTTLPQTFAVRPAINQFPHLEDFENAGTPQSQDFSPTLFRPAVISEQLFTWRVGRGFTPKNNTGPLTGFYRKGKYAYTTAPLSLNASEAVLISNRCIDLNGLNNPAISFAYHAYETKIKSLKLQARKVGEQWKNVTTINSTNFNAERDDWQMRITSLSNFKNEKISLRFVAKTNNAALVKDNLAIDQVMIYDRGTNDMGITAIKRPGEAAIANQNLALINPGVSVTNYGSATQSNLKIEMSVRRLCDATAQTKTFRDPGSTSLNAGSTLNAFAPIPLTLPKGACEVCAYIVNNTGDANRLNDTVCRIITGRGTFNNSFKATFDSCQYEKDGFAATGGLLQWEKGIPAGSVISSAQSSPNAWVTNLNGKYKNQLDEELRAPLFSSNSSLEGATIRFWQFLDSIPSGRIEFKGTNGWLPLGDSTDIFDWQNWYNGPFGSFGAKAFSGSSNGWKLSQAPLGAAQPLPNFLNLRFVLHDSIKKTGEGWAIDDFEIIIPPQYSVAPEQLLLPNIIPQVGAQPLSIRYKNTGEKTLTQWRTRIFINGSLYDSTSVTNQFLFKGNSKQVNYPRPLNLPAGNNTVMIVTSAPNGNKDDLPFDDTARFHLNVTPALDTAQACSDFENNDFLVRGFTKNQSLWQRSTPQKATLNGARSGSKAWITDTAGNYPNLAKAFIYTPLYNINKGTCYQLSFFHQFATEQNFDGGTVEFFIPGVTPQWNTLGSYDPNDSLWFNTAHIQAIISEPPGWTGSNGQWQKAEYRFTASDSGAVRFRFHFASGGSVTGEGWAIDDICIKNLGSNCDSVVSLREIAQQNHLQVYPNPARNTLHLEWLQAPTDAGMVQVVNTQGKLMYSQQAWQSPELTIDVSDWSSGIYFVIVRGKGAPVRRKIMVR